MDMNDIRYNAALIAIHLLIARSWKRYDHVINKNPQKAMPNLLWSKNLSNVTLGMHLINAARTLLAGKYSTQNKLRLM